MSIRTLLKACNPCNGCQREEHDRFGPCKGFEHCATLRAHIKLRHEIRKLRCDNKVIRNSNKVLRHDNKTLDIALRMGCTLLSGHFPYGNSEEIKKSLIESAEHYVPLKKGKEK